MWAPASLEHQVRHRSATFESVQYAACRRGRMRLASLQVLEPCLCLCLCLCLCQCLSACLPLSLCTCLTCLFVEPCFPAGPPALSACLPLCLCLSACLPLCLCVCVCICLPVCACLCVGVRKSDRQSVCLSVGAVSCLIYFSTRAMRDPSVFDVCFGS